MFTVTITKTTIEERPAGKDWEVVKGSRADKDMEYGYTPEIVKKREVELKIYEQTVDEIDIKAVIAAVNCEKARMLTEEEFLRDSPSGN